MPPPPSFSEPTQSDPKSRLVKTSKKIAMASALKDTSTPPISMTERTKLTQATTTGQSHNAIGSARTKVMDAQRSRKILSTLQNTRPPNRS